MARPKAADYDAQRDAILALAASAFAELGYASASMSQLAQACGTSKARLYHYFPSKESLLFESLDRYTRRLLGLVEGVLERDLVPRETLAELVRTLLVEYRDSQPYHVSLLNDVRFLEAALRARIESQQRAVVAALSGAIDRAAPGRFTRAERTPATMALLGMINFTFAWLRPDGPMSYERYAELVIDLWERGVGCAAGATAIGAQPIEAPLLRTGT